VIVQELRDDRGRQLVDHDSANVALSHPLAGIELDINEYCVVDKKARTPKASSRREPRTVLRHEILKAQGI